MNRKERIKRQMLRNKRNIRKKELNGYRRFSRMIPAKSFDMLVEIVDKESAAWEKECGR